MLLFNTKLHVYVQFAGQEKPLNSSAKIIEKQQKNITIQLCDEP